MTDLLTAAIEEFSVVVDDDRFPCTYATTALRQGTLEFVRVKWPRPADVVAAVEAYLAKVAELPPVRAAMLALVVFLDVPDGDVEAAAWEAVEALIDADPAGAAAAGPVDSPSWALTFRGIRLFVNISSPAHLRRRSRNLGSRVALVIQPRDGIDLIAPPDERGDRIRERIRRRVDRYDAIPRSPDLSTHGNAANRDWKQYWLADEPEGWTGECPIHRSALATP